MAGQLYVCGKNNIGEFLTPVNKSSPVQSIATGTNWSSFSGGRYFSAAVKTDGTLWTWGENLWGQLGTNNLTYSDSPVQTVAYGTTWSKVACGYYHTVSTKKDGTLWIWGQNNYGQLGDNTITNKSSPVQTVAFGTNWDSVAGGEAFTAAIKTDGTLWLWGINTQGQLGDNTTIRKSSPVQTVALSTNWSSVACGVYHTAGIKTDGTLWTWGYNAYGQLGDNTRISRSSPVQTITGGTNWSKVACGIYHIAAIKTDGTLWTFGWNFYGQLGDNTNAFKSSPIQTIALGTNWSSVSCESNCTKSVKTDGTIWLWGQNAYGQLGDNSIIHRSSPVQTISFGTNWSAVAGGLHHTITKKTDGTLWAWGFNRDGQIGDGSVFRYSPTSISNINNWSVISGNKGLNSNLLATKTDGTLWSWAGNSYGQLGDNNTLGKFSPVQTISGSNNWTQFSCSSNCTAGIKTDGTLWTWGNNANGQLGDNTTVRRSSPVQTVSGGINWISVSCGRIHVAAIKADGTLWTWGRNNQGQLGSGGPVGFAGNKSSPSQTLAFGTNWSIVSCGDFHTAAIKTDGTLWTWGQNSYGSLGDNTTISKSSPIQTVAGSTNWTSVACGYHFTAALKADGTLWTWGRNSFGQLGDNTTTNKSSPIQTITGGSNWNKISLGQNHIGAIKKDGTFWTWGRNSLGQLGDNTSESKSSPIQTIALGTNWYQIQVGYSSTFLLAENNPNQLTVNVQPQAGVGASQLIVQPTINISDSNGYTVRTATNVVSVAVQSGDATLSGTTTATAANGVATFTDLSLTGSGYVVLRFTSSGLTLADSMSFTIGLFLPIIPKRSEVSNKIPTSGQLNIGELAINIEDKRGYIKKSDGSVLNIFNGKVYDGGTF